MCSYDFSYQHIETFTKKLKSGEVRVVNCGETIPETSVNGMKMFAYEHPRPDDRDETFDKIAVIAAKMT